MSQKDHEHKNSPTWFHNRVTEIYGSGTAASAFLRTHLSLMHGHEPATWSWQELNALHSSLHPQEKQMPTPPTPPPLPDATARHYAADLLRRLHERAGTELCVGGVKAPDGSIIGVVSTAELYDWLEGLAIRLEAGANL